MSDPIDLSDLREWRKRIEEKRRQDAETSPEMLDYLRQAEVPIKALVDHPTWRVFQQTIQGLIEHTKAGIQEAEEMFRTSRDLSHEGLLQSRMAIACLEKRLETLTEVRDLPQQILQDVDDAREG